MRKVFLLLFVFMAAVAQAQDSTMKEYVGKYIFPEGGPVTSVEVYLDGKVLMANSSHGASTLEKKAKDTFAIISFDGTAYFTRNKNGQVAGVKIEVSDTVLEGTKEGVTAFLNRNNYFIAYRKPQ